MTDRYKWLGGLLGVVLFGVLLFVGPFSQGGAFVRPEESPHATTPHKPPPRPKPAPPAELRIPSQKIVAKVVTARRMGDTLLPPRKPKLVGWWDGSARPGAMHGSTVIAGHTVHTGGGALDKAYLVKKGAWVEVRTKTGKYGYRVSSVKTYSKEEFAIAAQRIFDQDGPARLVVVTCKDWDGAEYQSNVVVAAWPAGRGKPLK